MRLVVSLCTVMLLAGCGSVTPQSLWDQVTDIPEGYNGSKPSPADDLGEAEPRDDMSAYRRQKAVFSDDALAPFPEPSQISK